MNGSLGTIHTFVADTCVLIVVAYVLARGRMLTLLFRSTLTRRETVSLGLTLGLLALTEAIFPDARFPYAAHTLSVTFAAMAGGLHVGLITAGMASLGAFVSQRLQAGIGTMLAVFVSAFLGRSVRQVTGLRARLLGGLAAGSLAQACRILIKSALAGALHMPYHSTNAWISVPANGFGVMLLVLVVSDAQIRAESEQRRIDMERAHLLATEAQLAALRARVHPHFLFNTLTSIAALCDIAPDRAKAAIRGLGQLMRRALQTSAVTSICLAEEIETVRAYLDIEQERLGNRLRVTWSVDPACDGAAVPPFSVQTLAENAINHGIATKMGAGSLTVTVRCGRRHALVAVGDNGDGMSADARRRALDPSDTPLHGLQIINQHLLLLYGPHARLRLFSRKGRGTLAVFALPTPDPSLKGGETDGGRALPTRKTYPWKGERAP